MLSVRCLSVTLVYCRQTVGRTNMKLGLEVGLGPIVLDGDPASPQEGGGAAGLIKMLLGTEVDLGPDDIVLNRGPAPQFSAHVYCGQ